MYLGAEKLWLSDIVRLQPGTDILVIHSIIQRQRASPTNPQQILQRSAFLTGDVYELQRIHQTNPNTPTPAAAANNPQLPQRLTEDLTYRNDRSIRAKGLASYWKLKKPSARIDFDDIKGRWYEASLILPILQQGAFEEAARKGEIGEATLWMNSRGDCLNANRPQNFPKVPRANLYKATRLETFGRSLPANAQIKEGIEEPLPDNVDPQLEAMAGQSSMEIDPRFETAENQSSNEIRVSRPGQMEESMGVAGGGIGVGGGIDEFMNLDGVEEGGEMPGFGQEYSQEASQRGYY
jgi:hypothetical protein